jgi:hypothetical protein
MPQFQYQSLAEPSAAAATTEATQLDKWYQPLSLPVRPLQRQAAYVDPKDNFWAVLKPAFTPADGFGWENVSEPPRPLPRYSHHQQLAQPSLASVSTITLAVTSKAQSTNNAAITSTAFTPAAGDLLLVFGAGTVTGGGGGLGAVTDTQNLGWTRVAFSKMTSTGASDSPLECWVSNNFAVNSSMTVTYTPNGTTCTGTALAVYRVARMQRTGEDAVRSTGGQNNVVSGTPAPVLNQAALSDNQILTAVFNNTNTPNLTAPTVSSLSGWTRDTNVGYNTPATGMDAAWAIAGFTGTQVTWGSISGTNFASLAIELDDSANVELESWAHFYPDTVRPRQRLLDINYLSYGEGVFTAPSYNPGINGFPYVQPPTSPRPLYHVPNALSQDFAYGEGVFVKETVSVDRWLPSPNDPTRNRSRYPSWEGRLSQVILISEVIQVDKWEHFYPDWLRPLPRLTDRECLDFGEGVFTAQTVKVDMWWQQPSESPRPIRHHWWGDYGYGEGVFTAFSPVSGFPYEQASEPPRPLRHHWLGDYSTTLGVFVTETTALDKWWQPASLPVIVPRRIAPYAVGYDLFWQVFVGVFNPNTGFPYEQASEPPRPLKRLNVLDMAYGEGVFVTQTTTLDKWWQTASIPVIVPRRIAPYAVGYSLFWQVFVGVFNPATGFPYEQASEPTRPLRRELYGHSESTGLIYAAFSRETAQLGKWWRQTSEPTRNLRRVLYGLGDVTFVTEISFLSKWWQPTSLPVRPPQRIVPSIVGTLPFVVAFSPATGFPYEQASEPPRPFRRLTDREALRYGEGVFVKETTSVDRWVPLPNLPIRPLHSWLEPGTGPVFVTVMNVPIEFPFPEYHWVIPHQDLRYPYLQAASPFLHSIPETQPVQALAWWGLTQQEGAWGVD